jgi:hypothetical protein
MARSLADVRLAALMLDGLELKGRCCVVALGISTDGVKVPHQHADHRRPLLPLRTLTSRARAVCPSRRACKIWSSPALN